MPLIQKSRKVVFVNRAQESVNLSMPRADLQQLHKIMKRIFLQQESMIDMLHTHTTWKM